MSARAPMWLLIVYAALLFTHVPVWRSDLTLWTHAAKQAPYKPRPVLNYAKARLMAGDVDGATEGFQRTLRLAEQAHLPTYDRADARAAAEANLQMVPVFRLMFMNAE